MWMSSEIEVGTCGGALRRPEAGERIAIGRREHIFHEGDDADWLYEILSGAVALYRSALDGMRVIEGVRFPREIIGYSPHGVLGMSALAVEPCTLVRISRDAIGATDDLERAQRLLAGCAAELDRLSDQIVILSSRSAVGAMAATILDFSARGSGGSATVVLPLRRAELADLLGLTIETASRAISRLRAVGAIELTRPDVVRILDRARLHELAVGDGEGAARGRLAA
jgi:CRP-like cAMP-binding protein